MNSMLKIATLCFVLVFAACQSEKEPERKTVVTENEEIVVTKKEPAAPKGKQRKAPDFTLTQVVDDKSITLSDYSGKVVLLDFWATWCPPCKVSIPKINNLYTKYKDKGFQVISVSVDRIANFKDQDKLKKFIKQFSMNYPVVYVTREVRAKYGGIPSIPTVFILDKEGNVVSIYKGFSESIEKEIEETINQLL